MTITQAAEKAIRLIGGSPSLDQIFDKIIELNLYYFNTDVPKHVLRTQIHRHCHNVERVDTAAELLFQRVDPDNYKLTVERAGVIPRMRRIQRAKDKEDVIKLMGEELGVFKEIWKLLLFAASLGYCQKKRHPLGEIDTGKGIDQSTFGNCRAWPGIVHLFALVDHSDSSVLADENEDERLLAFEEYANGGLSMLKEHFTTNPPTIQSLIELVNQYSPAKDAPVLHIDLEI
jgi:dnd system-associated protein 4